MTDVCCPDDDQPNKRVEAKPSFSRGRSHTVVNVKRKRVLALRVRAYLQENPDA